MTAPVALFRADASPRIGGGHVRRCLTLAEALAGQGFAPAFACRPETFESLPALARSPWPVLRLDDEPNEPEALARCYPRGVDLLVIDHYGRGRDFERACRPRCRRILVLDDAPLRPHDADLLLDQTLGRQNSAYAGLVPPHCRCLCGTDHALLRPQFREHRTASLMRREVPELRRLLVNFGAGESGGLNVLAIEAVAVSGLPLEVDLVLGRATAEMAALEALAERLGVALRLHADVEDMASLMVAADLALGAGGVAGWERCSLGLPSLIVVMAENQRENARGLAAEGAALDLGDTGGLSSENIACCLKSLAKAPERLRRLARAASRLVDGAGAERVAGVVAAIDHEQTHELAG